MKNAKKSTVDQIESIVKDLLGKMMVEANVIVTEENENSYKVQIETPESGLLIGYHGEVINSLQLILGIFLYRQLGKWQRVIVDVGDYREKREEVVKKLAEEKAAEVTTTGTPVSLPYLSPLERRIIHMALSENPNVESYSEGEGKDRHIVLKPRENKK